jgi:putative FmdB family regulatory protein
MPIFEYVCCNCQEQFEQLVFDRQAKVACPACGSEKVDKCLSVFAHKSDSGFTSSAGGSACSGCSASSCSGCSD